MALHLFDGMDGSLSCALLWPFMIYTPVFLSGSPAVAELNYTTLNSFALKDLSRRFQSMDTANSNSNIRKTHEE